MIGLFGGGGGHDNIQPVMPLNFCMCVTNAPMPEPAPAPAAGAQP